MVVLVASLTTHYNLKNSIQKFFKPFESKEVKLSNERKKVTPNLICRQPYGNFSLLLQEIESRILESDINETDVIYLGVFQHLSRRN